MNAVKIAALLWCVNIKERGADCDHVNVGVLFKKSTAFQRAMNARKPKEQKLKERRHRLEAAIDVLAAQGVEVTTSSVAEYLDVTNKTIRYMVDEHPDFERDTKTGQIRRAHTVAPQE